MIAILSPADATVAVAAVAAISAWWQSVRTAKQMKPNAGSSMRDAVNRIESTLGDVVSRLDHGAGVMADFADRLAVVERKPRPPKGKAA